MGHINLYEEQLTAIGQILDGLNKMEGTVNYKHDSPGLNALLAAKLPIINDENDLLGWAEDEVGGIWSFRIATDEEIERYREEHAH